MPCGRAQVKIDTVDRGGSAIAQQQRIKYLILVDASGTASSIAHSAKPQN